MTMERPEQELLSNPRSDRVKAVARLSGRSARQRAGRFVVEGPQAVREAVALAAGGLPPGAPGTLRDLYATIEAAQRYPQIVDAAGRVDVAARLVTDEVFAAMVAETGTLTPQGLLAVCDLISAGLGPVLDGRRRWSRCSPRSATRATPAR